MFGTKNYNATKIEKETFSYKKGDGAGAFFTFWG